MSAPAFHTAEMVRALTDETRHWPRYETVHGELLVTNAPRLWHQEVVARLMMALHAYTKRERVGHVFLSPSDISWSPDTLVQPDVFVVPVEEARTMSWATVHTLLLAIEVLSPSSVRADRITKRQLYQEVGIPLYWVLDADKGIAEIWTPVLQLPRVERDKLVWRPAGAGAAFELGMAELLRPI